MEAVTVIQKPVAPSQPVPPVPEASQRQEGAPSRAAPPEPKKKEEKESEIDRVVTERVADSIQQYLQSTDVRLKFQVHEDSGEIRVKVINEKTGEVIREVPPERILHLASKIDELIGTLLDIKI